MSDTMKVEISIDCELCRDLIVTAIEGGINYWASAARLLSPDHKLLHTFDWYKGGWPIDSSVVRIYPDEPINDGAPEWYEIDKKAVQQGLQIMKEKFPYHFANLFLEGNWDAETADVFVQCCIFGDIVYG